MDKLEKIVNKIYFFVKSRLNFRGYDLSFLLVLGIILLFGLVVLSSASSAYAYTKYGDNYFFVKRQIAWAILGITSLVILSKVDYHLWRKYAFWMLVISVGLLITVFIPGLGADYGTSRSWINVFGLSIQPAEFVKISFLIYLAALMEANKRTISESFEGTAPFLIVLGIVSILMLKQPDFGTLSIILAVSMLVYFVGGGRVKYILALVFFGIIALMVMIHFKPYQADRFRCFSNPDYDKKGVCYQVDQSLIAIGSGGLMGRGLGESRQKFMYIPEVSGDFIFAIVAEETGMITGSILLALFVFLFYRGYKIALGAQDYFGRILAIGIVSWLVIQAIINIGGVINIMPMTGVPLPFISYGGSSIFAALSAVGILMNISKHSRT